MKQISKHTVLRMLVSEFKDMNRKFEYCINSIEYFSTYYMSCLLFCATNDSQSDKELTKEG